MRTDLGLSLASLPVLAQRRAAPPPSGAGQLDFSGADDGGLLALLEDL